MQWVHFFSCDATLSVSSQEENTFATNQKNELDGTPEKNPALGFDSFWNCFDQGICEWNIYKKKKNNSVEPKSKGVIKLSLWKVGTNGEFNWHLNTKSLSAYENVVQYITQMVELQIATTFWNLIILGRSRSSQAWTVIRLCNNSSGMSCTSL